MSSKLRDPTQDRDLGVGVGDKPSGAPGLFHSLRSLPAGFQEVGWYPGLEERYSQALPNVTVPNTTCHLPRPDAFHMFRDPVRGDLPWPGLIFGLTVLATWCWCSDQVMPLPSWASSPPAGRAPVGKPHVPMHRGLGLAQGDGCGAQSAAMPGLTKAEWSPSPAQAAHLPCCLSRSLCRDLSPPRVCPMPRAAPFWGALYK